MIGGSSSYEGKLNSNGWWCEEDSGDGAGLLVKMSGVSVSVAAGEFVAVEH